MAQFNFHAIGTTWRIDIFDNFNDISGKAAKEVEILARVKKRIEAFDKAYSRFRPDSLVTEMSKKSGTYELPPDAEPMMLLYHDLYKKTGGLVTPLIGNLISDAGYDAQYSLLSKKTLKAPPTWDEAIEYRPSDSSVADQGIDRLQSNAKPTLIVKHPVLLDFGAAGKGYLIDLVGEVLEENGVLHYGINAGGDILYMDKRTSDKPKHDATENRGSIESDGSIQIGLEDPEDAGKVIGVCDLESGSICGSAGNRRKWGKFTHIINPKTLESPSDIIAVWITAKTALLADALATCLFFVPAANLSDDYDFEYVLVRKDRSVEKSEGFMGKLSISSESQSTSH
jgi:thiamine biosynthesis lipoprotein